MFLSRLIYYSRPTIDLAAGVVAQTVSQILKAGLPKDNHHGLTGVLVLDGDRFIHVIEGEREEVFDVFKRMLNDTHQDSVHLIAFEEVSERVFETWDVAFNDPEKIIDVRTHGYNTMTSDALLERARRLRNKGISVHLDRPRKVQERLWA